MSKKPDYRQFVFERETEDGSVCRTTAWSPVKKNGKVIGVGSKVSFEGETEVWTVVSASESIRTAEEVRAAEKARRNFGPSIKRK